MSFCRQTARRPGVTISAALPDLEVLVAKRPLGRRPSTGSGLLAAAGFLLFLPGLAPSASASSYRVARGAVKVTVPLLPGGAFEAKTTSLSGTLVPGSGRPLPLSGELSVDLTSIDTGIDLRNRHLREKYLEVAKGSGYDKAVLSGIRVNDAADEAFQGRTAFSGTLLLHGGSHPVSGTAEIRRQGEHVRVQARFALALTDFGIEPPEYLGVGVANRLLIAVELVAAPAGGGTP